MKKHEIAVFIENEEMLKEARELLEKYGEDIDYKMISLIDDVSWNYLIYSVTCDDWFIGKLLNSDTQCTLPQLEEILNEAKKDRTCTNNCSVVCGECQLPIQTLPQLEQILKNQ